MKVYLLRYSDNDLGNCQEWFTNKREGERRLAEIRREAKELMEQEQADLNETEKEYGGFTSPDYVLERDPFPDAEVRPVDIPTDRKGLVQWLDAHFSRDNG